MREDARFLGGTFVRALVIFGALLAFLVITGFATGTIQKWSADWRGDVAAKEQTKANGSFRVSTYNDFFNLCSSVQSDEDAIRNAQDEMKDPDTTPDRKAKLRQNITATKNTRAESIRDYNAKAANEYKAAFRSQDLPASLSINNYNTQCAYTAPAGE